MEYTCEPVVSMCKDNFIKESIEDPRHVKGPPMVRQISSYCFWNPDKELSRFTRESGSDDSQHDSLKQNSC